jgi:hypothetical protein
MQVRGGRLQRLGPGQIFYESPEDVHTVSRNASKTKPERRLGEQEIFSGVLRQIRKPPSWGIANRATLPAAPSRAPRNLPLCVLYIASELPNTSAPARPN